MKKLLFGVVVFSSFCFAMQRLDQRPLSDHFVQKTMHAEWNVGNYGFFFELRRRSNQTTSAQELFELCTKHARSDDWACERKEEIRPDNCTVIGQAKRHLHCWWLHKQALTEAMQQK